MILISSVLKYLSMKFLPHRLASNTRRKTTRTNDTLFSAYYQLYTCFANRNVYEKALTSMFTLLEGSNSVFTRRFYIKTDSNDTIFFVQFVQLNEYLGNASKLLRRVLFQMH